MADKCVPANSVKFFASDCIVRFNNQDPAQGRDAAQQVCEALMPSRRDADVSVGIPGNGSEYRMDEA